MKLFSRKLLFLATVPALFLAVLIGITSWWYYQGLLPRQHGEGSAIVIRIQAGDSSAEIARELEQENIIKSASAFRFYLRLHGLSGELSAGNFRVHSYLSAQEIADIITGGDMATANVTIISGWRLDQIKEELLEADYAPNDIDNAFAATYNFSILQDKPANASLEGYLFPDTYEILLGSPASELIEKILTNTEEKVTPEIREAWAKKGLSIHEGLTMASIVQKEVPTPEEQRKVAQVFLSRLEEDMKLEADPTYQYAAAIEGIEASVGLDSPYNTYMHAGLPPGPISNVSSSAIEAVAFPKSTEYLYFVTGRDSVTRFAKTLAEHEANIAEYGVTKP